MNLFDLRRSRGACPVRRTPVGPRRAGQAPRLLALLALLCVAAAPEPADVSELSLEPGLSLRVYDLGEHVRRLPDLVEGQTGNVNKRVPTPDLGGDDFGLDDGFYAELDGFLLIDQAGEYEFELASDDGSEFILGGQVIISHDGPHDDQVAMDAAVTLDAGVYPLKLRLFEGRGGQALRLQWRTPGSGSFTIVPAEALRTEANQVRVTSPGAKQFTVPDGQLENQRRPGDRSPLAGVHPALKLVELRPPGFEPKVGGMDFLPDGRLVLCTWDPQGDVFVLGGVTGDATDVTVQRFATGLAEPLGVKVLDGRVFVLQKQELTELIDPDGDGTADEYRSVASGWPVTDNFHEFAFGLAEQDGKLLALLAVAIDPGGKTTVPQVVGRGTAIAIDPDTGSYETVAAGLRTPNGIGRGVDGQVFIADNQGDWMPSSKLVHLQDRAFYNSYLTPPHPFSDPPRHPAGRLAAAGGDRQLAHEPRPDPRRLGAVRGAHGPRRRDARRREARLHGEGRRRLPGGRLPVTRRVWRRASTGSSSAPTGTCTSGAWAATATGSTPAASGSGCKSSPTPATPRSRCSPSAPAPAGSRSSSPSPSPTGCRRGRSGSRTGGTSRRSSTAGRRSTAARWTSPPSPAATTAGGPGWNWPTARRSATAGTSCTSASATPAATPCGPPTASRRGRPRRGTRSTDCRTAGRSTR